MVVQGRGASYEWRTVVELTTTATAVQSQPPWPAPRPVDRRQYAYAWVASVVAVRPWPAIAGA